MKLSKGKNLLVYFGCLPIKKEETKKEEDAHELDWEERKRKILSKRTKLVEGLNRNRELRNVSDLFAKLPSELVFNPVLFSVHIPLSLQKALYVFHEPIRAQTEDFEVVYDGFLLMVATLCDLRKVPYGVFDVRDKISAILETIIKVEEVIPPTLFGGAVAFVTKGDEKTVSASVRVVISQPKRTESRTVLRKLYKQTYYEAGRFYGACLLRKKMLKQIEEIRRNESRLLSNLRDFLDANWIQIRKKRKLIAECKKGMANILEMVSQYLLDRDSLEHERKLFRTFPFREGTTFTQIIKERDFDFYTEPDVVLDTDSVFKVTEHVRGEIEAYSLNTSTLFSALLGAVAGSVITLLLSYLLGVFASSGTPSTNSTLAQTMHFLASLLFFLF